ncbi:unnamed protein product [Timema podura]|uniref:Malate dehydrogenase, mitochondrial n=1 Tax=Timema podura TaxID=61482 RepID=A0ABN7P1P3_TIMPD|nr:unnamed protein product [Timema podura]
MEMTDKDIVLRSFKYSNYVPNSVGRRHFRSFKCRKRIKVTIIGAGGRFGQTAALLLKQSPRVDVLAMYDNSDINCGTALDLAHVDTKCRVMAYCGEDQFDDAMTVGSYKLTLDRGSILDLLIVVSLVYCESSALDQTATEVGIHLKYYLNDPERMFKVTINLGTKGSNQEIQGAN